MTVALRQVPHPGATAIRLLVHAVRFAFFVSFAVPVLNPAINGTALYFYIWLPFLDLQFVRKIALTPFSGPATLRIAGAALLFVILLHDLEMTLRLTLMAIQLVYLCFLLDRGLLRYLSWALVAHVAVAVLQLAFFFTPGGVPEIITPTGMATAVWGASLAPATFTNFGMEAFLPRVSGLHRESGFFSAFVMSLYLVFSASGYFRGRRWLGVLIAMGLLASFSKITFAIGILLVVHRFRDAINRVPLWITAVSFFAVCMLTARVVYGTLGQEALALGEGTAVSFVHRFFGYYALQQLSFRDFLVGSYTAASDLWTPEIRRIADTLYANIIGLREYNLFPGMGGIAMRGGVIAVAGFIALLAACRVRSAAFVALVVATFAVSIDTLQNFVALVWLAVAIEVLRGRPDAASQPASRLR